MAGGFAEHAAAARGVEVHRHHAFACATGVCARARGKKGLADRVTLEYIDYRDVQGQYDYIVSIEMFEAVGERYWPTYFKAVYGRLKPGGRAVIQAITIDEVAFPATAPPVTSSANTSSLAGCSHPFRALFVMQRTRGLKRASRFCSARLRGDAGLVA